MSNILNGITEAKRSLEPNYNDPSWDEKVSNVGKKAKEGPRKTVWVPDQYGKGGRYTTVPVNAPKKDEPTKESVGLPYPGTYEETNDMFKSSGQRRIGTLTTEQGVAEGSEIKIPTEDGITMQDIRLMAGDGPLTKKTVLQAIAVIRKQRRPQGVAEAYGRYDRRDAYQRDYDHSVAGIDRPSNHRDDERHDLDPTDWYIVKDGKMLKASVYPRQVQQAIAQGFSPNREEAQANADQQGVAEGSLNESDKFTSWYDWKDQAKSSGYTITKKDDKIVALNKQGQVVGHWSDVGKFLSGKAPRPNFKRPEGQGVEEGDQDPQSELKMINQKLKDAYKRVRNNSSVSIGWYMSEVKALNARREELIKQLRQGVAEAAPVNTTPEFTQYVYSKLRKNFSDPVQVEDLFDYAYLSDVTLGAISDAMEENGTSAKQELKERLTWLLKNMNNRKYLSVIKPIAVEWMKLVAPTLGRQGVDEEKQRLDPKCWTGKHKEGTKMKGGVRVNNCVPNESAIMKGIKV